MMKIKVLRDATLTVTAGQIIDVKDDQVKILVKLGFAEIAKEPAKSSKSTKRS